MKLLSILLATTITSVSLYAQVKKPDGGGGYTPPKAECISPAESLRIQHMLDSNREVLIKKGILPDKKKLSAAKTTATLFDWPLHQVSGGYYNCYGISNFVDHDPVYPSSIQDWNCGNRSYDLSSGYNHGGMDIFLWPFSWNMMESEQVEIVAAAPGVIIGKTDGNYDHNCAMGSGTWNSVYIQHTDGTVAWYGHMKTGTPTTAAIGTSVAAGTHLGFVGSSGSSTGPHLHFEVHDASGNILDPYSGLCNAVGTMWNTPKPYYESKVNTLMTHFAPPSFSSCPLPDVINRRDTFVPGSTIYFVTYYHDQLAGQTTNYTIFRPDNSVYNTWNGASTTAFYAASYWYWTYTIPATQPTGKWKFQAVYEGSTYSRDFYILQPGSNTGNSVDELTTGITVFPNPMGDELTIVGETSNGKDVQFILCDMSGRTVLTRQLTGTGINTTVNMQALSQGIYLYRLEMDGIVTRQGKLVKQ